MIAIILITDTVLTQIFLENFFYINEGKSTYFSAGNILMSVFSSSYYVREKYFFFIRFLWKFLLRFYFNLSSKWLRNRMFLSHGCAETGRWGEGSCRFDFSFVFLDMKWLFSLKKKFFFFVSYYFSTFWSVRIQKFKICSFKEFWGLRRAQLLTPNKLGIFLMDPLGSTSFHCCPEPVELG